LTASGGNSGLLVAVKMPPAVTTPAEFLADARAVEEAGVDAIFMPEALIRPATTRDSTSPAGHAAPPGLEPWSLLSAVAGVTQRVRLGVAVSVVAMWPPVLFAAVINALEHVSGGRVTIGVGAGWEEFQFAATGVPFEGRGKRLTEFIAALRHVLGGTGEPFEGEFYKVPDIRMAPSYRGCPPVIMGGATDTAVERAVSIGDGWIRDYGPASEAGPAFAAVRAKRQELGDRPFELWAEADPPASRDEWLRDCELWRAAGADGVIVQGLGKPDWRKVLADYDKDGGPRFGGIRVDHKLLEVLR
jgi:alkanesulfonate monooxygenase SsuD/methylene tetrahydromethanopterin reductase-like flavin-dependent oxidoreductase (luciferase family)